MSAFILRAAARHLESSPIPTTPGREWQVGDRVELLPLLTLSSDFLHALAPRISEHVFLTPAHIGIIRRAQTYVFAQEVRLNSDFSSAGVAAVSPDANLEFQRQFLQSLAYPSSVTMLFGTGNTPRSLKLPDGPFFPASSTSIFVQAIEKRFAIDIYCSLLGVGGATSGMYNEHVRSSALNNLGEILGTRAERIKEQLSELEADTARRVATQFFTVPPPRTTTTASAPAYADPPPPSSPGNDAYNRRVAEKVAADESVHRAGRRLRDHDDLLAAVFGDAARLRLIMTAILNGLEEPGNKVSRSDWISHARRCFDSLIRADGGRVPVDLVVDVLSRLVHTWHERGIGERPLWSISWTPCVVMQHGVAFGATSWAQREEVMCALISSGVLEVNLSRANQYFRAVAGQAVEGMQLFAVACSDAHERDEIINTRVNIVDNIVYAAAEFFTWFEKCAQRVHHAAVLSATQPDRAVPPEEHHDVKAAAHLQQHIAAFLRDKLFPGVFIDPTTSTTSSGGAAQTAASSDANSNSSSSNSKSVASLMLKLFTLFGSDAFEKRCRSLTDKTIRYVRGVLRRCIKIIEFLRIHARLLGVRDGAITELDAAAAHALQRGLFGGALVLSLQRIEPLFASTLLEGRDEETRRIMRSNARHARLYVSLSTNPHKAVESPAGDAAPAAASEAAPQRQQLLCAQAFEYDVATAGVINPRGPNVPAPWIFPARDLVEIPFASVDDLIHLEWKLMLVNPDLGGGYGGHGSSGEAKTIRATFSASISVASVVDNIFAKDSPAKNDKAFLAPFVEENLGQKSHHPLPYAVLLSPTAWVPVTPSAVAAPAAVVDVPPNRCGGVRVWFDIVPKKQ